VRGRAAVQAVWIQAARETLVLGEAEIGQRSQIEIRRRAIREDRRRHGEQRDEQQRGFHAMRAA